VKNPHGKYFRLHSLFCERRELLARSRQSLKRLKTDTVKNERNHRKLKRLRTAIKKVNSAETPEERMDAVKLAQSLIDKAGRTRLMHPNKAKRLKSRVL